MEHLLFEQKVKAQLNSLDYHYYVNFAFKPRSTRDINLLQSMIDDLERLLHQAKKEGLEKVVNDEIRAKKEFFLSELRSIVALTSNEKINSKKNKINDRLFFLDHRYKRHFANQNRADRDQNLLNEMILENIRILESIESLENGSDIDCKDSREMQENLLELFKEEMEAIRLSFNDLNPENKLKVLFSLFDQQLYFYKAHFANKPRLSRSPELLLRLIKSLEYLETELAILESAQTNEIDKKRTADEQNGFKDRIAAQKELFTSEFEKIETEYKVNAKVELINSIDNQLKIILDFVYHSGPSKLEKSEYIETLSFYSEDLEVYLMKVEEIAKEYPGERFENLLKKIYETLYFTVSLLEDLKTHERETNKPKLKLIQ